MSSFCRVGLKGPCGVFHALVGGILLGVHGLGTNLLAHTVSPWIICFCFTVFHVVVFPFIDWDLSSKYTSKKLLLILTAGFFGTTHLCFISFAFEFSTVGNTSAILYTKPLFSAIFGKLIIKEPLTLIDASLILANFIGVTLVGKPSFIFRSNTLSGESSSRNLIGASLSLIGAICGALQYVTIRKLVADDTFNIPTVLAAKTLVGFLIYSLGVAFHMVDLKPIETPLEWFYLSIVCVCGLAEVLFTFLALETLNAKAVALITAVSVLTSYFLQICFTKDDVDPMAIVGALLITTAPLVYGVIGIRDQICRGHDQENMISPAGEEFNLVNYDS